MKRQTGLHHYYLSDLLIVLLVLFVITSTGFVINLPVYNYQDTVKVNSIMNAADSLRIKYEMIEKLIKDKNPK